jgi:hypothetical protein
LQPSPLTTAKESTPSDAAPTGADLVAAMQASLYKDISLEPIRHSMPQCKPGP